MVACAGEVEHSVTPRLQPSEKKVHEKDFAERSNKKKSGKKMKNTFFFLDTTLVPGKVLIYLRVSVAEL